MVSSKITALGGALSALVLTLAGTSRAAQEYSYPLVYNVNTLKRENLHYTDSSNTSSLTGYLSYQSSSNATRPGVIIVPDWDGISNYERWRADLFASMGYVGFVADIYGDSVQQGARLSIPERQQLTKKYNSDLSLLHSRLQSALATMRGLNLVQVDKIAAVGYCFGGGAVLELARLWPDTTGLVGVVSFHGSPLVRNGSRSRPNNPIAVQVHNGFNDTGVTRGAIASLEAELSTANATWAFTDYSNTAHAFTVMENPVWNGTGQIPHIAYNPMADKQSWWALRGFLLDVFGFVNTTNPYIPSRGLSDVQTGFAGSSVTPS